MQSLDPRVRAGAIEALWHHPNDDTRSMLEAALADPHHRVMGNALVGLYGLGEFAMPWNKFVSYGTSEALEIDIDFPKNN